jgi:peptidoglycan/xylan/chitin deacetylase (PgdA/CDA1 family)
MRKLLKKYVQPVLRNLHIDTNLYRLFFSLRSVHTGFSNAVAVRCVKTVPVLTYHRIADVDQDPQKLCVAPDVFEAHLQFLTAHYEVVSLSVLLERLQEKNLTGKEAVITFDDGYRDNLQNALPLLEKYQIPATIFITTAYLGEQANFAWDQEYTENDRAQFLTTQEIQTLSRNPLIEIGGHTHTHQRLSELSVPGQEKEIQENKDILQEIISKPIIHFAYPFGGIFDYTKQTRALVQDAGFQTISTTTQKFVTATSELTDLARFNIRNFSAETLAKTLRTNVTN